MAPLVLGTLARRGSDSPWLAGAAASARLTHAEPEALAGAVLFALALESVAATGDLRGTAAHLARAGAGPPRIGEARRRKRACWRPSAPRRPGMVKAGRWPAVSWAWPGALTKPGLRPSFGHCCRSRVAKPSLARPP
jgi:hypothetical protein